jgi:hypothetical protein
MGRSKGALGILKRRLWAMRKPTGDKGGCARCLRQEDFPEMRSHLWGNHFWSPIFCIVFCGDAPPEPLNKGGCDRSCSIPAKGCAYTEFIRTYMPLQCQPQASAF